MSLMSLPQVSDSPVRLSHECADASGQSSSFCLGLDFSDSQLGEACECPCHCQTSEVPLCQADMMALHIQLLSAI